MASREKAADHGYLRLLQKLSGLIGAGKIRHTSSAKSGQALLANSCSRMA
jgi:hypothetical protein